MMWRINDAIAIRGRSISDTARPPHDVLLEVWRRGHIPAAPAGAEVHSDGASGCLLLLVLSRLHLHQYPSPIRERRLFFGFPGSRKASERVPNPVKISLNFLLAKGVAEPGSEFHTVERKGDAVRMCPTCAGTGDCPTCHGSGYRVTARNDERPHWDSCPTCWNVRERQSTGRCPTCHGLGETID